MPRFIKILIAALLVAYPLLVYYGLNNNFSGAQLGMVLLVLFVIRLFFTRLQTSRDRLQMFLPLAMVMGLVILTWFFQQPHYLLWYPVGLNFTFLILFAFSLWHPPTVIESIARRMRKDMPAEVIVYTRKVTMVWCVFFAVNMLVAAWTVLSGSIELWTIYNGFISYIIAFLILSGEILIRKYFIQRNEASK